MNEGPLPSASEDTRFLLGGGEMGERMRRADWSKTPLGAAGRWPQNLKTAVRIMLTSRQPMFVWWGDELINLYNDAYRAIVGGKHPDALGQPAARVWREIWDQVEPRAATAMNENIGTYDESLLLIMERNGYPEETYYTFSYSPVPNDHGGTGGIICANTDDTDRIVGERQLALLRDLAARTADARTLRDACAVIASGLAGNPRDLPFAMIYLVDPDRRHVRLAASCGMTSGHAAAPDVVEVAGESAWPFARALETNEMCLVPDLRASFGELPTGAWSRSPGQAVVVPIASASQSAKSAIMIAGLNPLRLFDDRYRRFIALISAQIAAGIANAQAYEEEKRRSDALAELDRAKTAFFSNVSHEFRTPLTLLLGPLEDALGRPAEIGPVVRGDLELAHRNGLRLLKLVNTLLDFSRIEAGRTDLVYQPTELGAYTAELASGFRSAIERAGMTLAVECPSLPEPVYVDRQVWEKVVLNLLSNAFKHTFEGEIAIALRAVDGVAELTVRDTGIGIPAEALPQLFDRFYRVQGARARTHEGSGIGLALVHQLIQLHGGRIRIESDEGVGSAFIVSIPLGREHLPPDRIGAERTLASTAVGAEAFAEEALRWIPAANVTSALSARPLAEGEPSDPTGKGRIVLADDNADMRVYVSSLLAPLYRVEAVGDGATALRAIRRERPDLVLTDVMMPGLDGFALLGALRQDPATRDVPVIMLSARAGEEARIDGLGAGADDYLAKPFSARELLARVAAHLRMSRFRAQALRRERALRSEAETLYEVARGLVGELDLPTLLQKVTDAGTELTGAEFGAFVDDGERGSGKWGIFSAQPGAAGGAWARSEAFRLASRFALGVDGRAVVRLDDVSSEPGGRLLPHSSGVSEERPAVRSCLSVPVTARSGQNLGRLLFCHPDPGVFTEHSERLALGIAAQAAIAIDNAQLLTQTKGEIRERARFEGALRESEQRYRELLHALPVAVCASDAGGRVVMYNEAAVTLWGCKPDTGTGGPNGAPPLYTFDGAPLSLDWHHLAADSRGEHARGRDAVVERPDGTRRHVLVYPQPMRDLSGEFAGAINVLVDITDRERTEAELATTKDHLSLQLATLTRLHDLAIRLGGTPEIAVGLQAILETLVDVHGAQHGLLSLGNPTTGRLDAAASVAFDGAALAALGGVTPGLEAAGSCGAAFATGRRAVIEDTETDARFDAYRETARSVGFRAVHSTPILTRAGNILGVLSVHFDTPRHPTDQQMQLADMCARHAADAIESARSHQDLVEADRRKDEFLATLAHELRNPLAPISYGLHVMSLALDNRESAEQVRSMMERQVHQMVRLVDDLLDVSRISRGKIELRKEQVDLATVVMNALETSRPLIQAAGHELVVSMSPEPVFVDADVTRLAQAVANLLNNAAKYTRRGGHIRLAVEQHDGVAAVSVRDDGIGIPTPMLPRVFDLFMQVDRSLEKMQGGLGIGLTLVKRLVEMHDGTVEARSDGPGAGSEFVIRLPSLGSALRAPGSGRGEGPATATERRRVLVVDDNLDSALALSMMLEVMGHETRTAHDGLEAIDAAAAFRPRLILLDIGMPKLNGYDACRRLRQAPWGRSAAIVALTGWGQEEDKRRSAEAGFDHHLVKPVDPLALKKLLASLH